MNLRKLIITVCALVALGGATATTAQAQLKICSVNEQIKIELKCGNKVLHKHVTANRWIKNRVFRTLQASNPVAAKRWRGVFKFHRWMIHRALRWIEQARSRLHNKSTSLRLSATGIAHYALWNCIHNGAYPGAPHEGNSSSGTYTGPLQMTYPWAGHYVHWYYVPITTVYEIAENEYRAHGYSTVWLEGQWPNTSPPCLKFAG